MARCHGQSAVCANDQQRMLHKYFGGHGQHCRLDWGMRINKLKWSCISSLFHVVVLVGKMLHTGRCWLATAAMLSSGMDAFAAVTAQAHMLGDAGEERCTLTTAIKCALDSAH